MDSGCPTDLVTIPRMNRKKYAPGLKDSRAALNVEWLPLRQALRVKSAEYWLKLGDAQQASLELEELPEKLRNHRWVLRIQLAAIYAMRQQSHPDL